jgi:hypothetical protein
VHPVANIGPDDIIGTPKWTSRIVNGEGDEIGLETTDGKYSLAGDDYQEFKKLAEAIVRTKRVAAVASTDYVTNRIWEWVQQSYSTGVTCNLSQHLEQALATDVKTTEYWMPLHRTFSMADLQIGEVRFRTLSRELMERWEQEAIAVVGKSQENEVRQLFSKKRSMMQGSLAVVLTTTGVPDRAREVALEKADRAVSLLRFLSPANWTPKLRSYCTLLGHESIAISHTLQVVEGRLGTYQQSAESGQHAWSVPVELLPGGEMDLLTPLHALALGKSEFQKQILDAVLIHSRNSIAKQAADKLLFVMVALESMLLRNENEPIQKNIAERMALLVGQTVEQRLQIIENTTTVYGLRSKFVHHGRTDVDNELVSKFMLNAWTCFCVLLGEQHKYGSKEDLIVSLEKRKMAG